MHLEKSIPTTSPPHPELGSPEFKSQTIGKLALALAKAQAELKNAHKDKTNPFFNSSYADLASVWDACREPLTKNELSVTQPLSMDPQGRIILTTILMHSSNEWIASQCPVISKAQDPQAIGSAITYFRRYALSAITGVSPAEDDDGNAASKGNNNHTVAPKTKSLPTQNLDKEVREAITEVRDEERDAGNYVVQFGKKYKDLKLSQIPLKELQSYAGYLIHTSKEKGETPQGKAAEFLEALELYKEQQGKGNVIEKGDAFMGAQKDVDVPPPGDSDIPPELQDWPKRLSLKK